MILSYDKAVSITPDDAAPNVFSAIYVGGTGDLTVVTKKGDTVTFKAVPVGVTIPVATTLVKATGTTATLLVGMNA